MVDTAAPPDTTPPTPPALAGMEARAAEVAQILQRSALTTTEARELLGILDRRTR